VIIVVFLIVERMSFGHNSESSDLTTGGTKTLQNLFWRKLKRLLLKIKT